MRNSFVEKELRKLKEHECLVACVIARKKENESLKSNIIYRAVLAKEYYEGGLRKLKAIDNGLPYYTRKYITMNPRDLREAVADNHEDIMNIVSKNKGFNRFARIPSKFKSALQKKKCRSKRKYHLIDIDTKDVNPDKVLRSAHEGSVRRLVYKTETPNGYHLVIECNDTQDFRDMEDVEVHTDSLTLVPDLLDGVKFK